MNSDRWIDRVVRTANAARLEPFGDGSRPTVMLSGVRVTSVALSRRAISAGRYESDAVLDATLVRLSSDLNVLLVGD